MTRPQGSATDKLDDADYPPYTIGTAAALLGVQPAFLRSLDAAGLLTPGCSAGGQRCYSRAELAPATRVRELLDQNMLLTAPPASSASNTSVKLPTGASPTSNRPSPSATRNACRREESGRANPVVTIESNIVKLRRRALGQVWGGTGRLINRTSGPVVVEWLAA